MRQVDQLSRADYQELKVALAGSSIDSYNISKWKCDDTRSFGVL